MKEGRGAKKTNSPMLKCLCELLRMYGGAVAVLVPWEPEIGASQALHPDPASASNTGFPCVINLHVFDTFVLCKYTVRLLRNGVMRRHLRANKGWVGSTIQWRKGASAKCVTSGSSSAVVSSSSSPLRPSVSAGYRGQPDGGMKPSEPRLSSARRFRGSCCRSTPASPGRSGAGIAPMI